MMEDASSQVVAYASKELGARSNAAETGGTPEIVQALAG